MEARSRALVSEGETAERCYREAIDRLGRTQLRPELARAHLLYGEWLRRENRRRDARAELRTAYDLFTTMGIEAFAERARRELLATGDTVRKRTVQTASELTAQEAHIARLAVDGRTNAEIGAQLYLSTRTVEWHLSKVYAKLGVGSRRELRRALATSGRQTRRPSDRRPRHRPATLAWPAWTESPLDARNLPFGLRCGSPVRPVISSTGIQGTIDGAWPPEEAEATALITRDRYRVNHEVPPGVPDWGLGSIFVRCGRSAR